MYEKINNNDFKELDFGLCFAISATQEIRLPRRRRDTGRFGGDISSPAFGQKEYLKVPEVTFQCLLPCGIGLSFSQLSPPLISLLFSLNMAFLNP